MRQGFVYQISKEEYKKALAEGAHTLIGSHMGEVISADVEQAEDGTYWLQFICEVSNG